MNKKTISIILSLIIIGAFFLPYLSYDGENFSGMNVIFGNEGFTGLHNQKSGNSLLISLLIPLGALFALFRDNSPIGNLSRWMPLIGVVYLLVMLYIRATSGGSVDIGEFVGFFGYGLWITLVAAILLPFMKD